jgi:hypothetical protein
VQPTSASPPPFEPLGPVDWALGKVFLETLLKPILYTVLPDRVDPRDWMQGDRPRVTWPLEPLGDGDADYWFDFVADTGDSDIATYNLAYLFHGDLTVQDPDGLLASSQPALLGSPAIAAGASATAGTVLRRGAFLFVGGDTAYPVADFAQLEARFTRPLDHAYRQRFLVGDAPEARPLFGIPGNHDWYDNLDGFNRVFRRPPASVTPSRCSTKLEPPLGHVPLQQASYFVLDLPGGWELWALDARNDTDVDHRQRAFFASQPALAPGRNLLIATPTPPFVYGAKEPWAEALFEQLPAHARLATRLWFSGDTHHYARYEQARVGSTQLTSLVSGLGGAALHAPSRGAIEAARTYPGVDTAEAEVSRELGARLVRYRGMRRLGAGLGLCIGACALQHSGEVAPQLDRLWPGEWRGETQFAWLSITLGIGVVWLVVKFLRRPSEAEARRIPGPRRVWGAALPVLVPLLLIVLLSLQVGRTFANVVLDLTFELTASLLLVGVPFLLVFGLPKPRSWPRAAALVLAALGLAVTTIVIAMLTARTTSVFIGARFGEHTLSALCRSASALLVTVAVVSVAFPVGAGFVLKLALRLGSHRAFVSSFAAVHRFQAFIRFRLRVRGASSRLTGFVIAVDEPVSAEALRRPRSAGDLVPTAKLIDVFNVD